MANRDLSNFRQVTNQVVENKNELLTSAAKVGEQILRSNEEAKIANGVSKAQLEVSALENQYRIDFQGDPLGGMDQFKKDRKAIFDEVGKGISPLYGRDWAAKSRAIAERGDASQQAWGIKQSRVNTVSAVNETMTNNFKQASNDGQTFGLSDESDVEAFVNFGTSLENISEFATNNLGSETSKGMLESYEEDYLKSFISGVSETSPHKALGLMETDQVKDGFRDIQQFQKFKRSVEIRANRFDKANKQRAGAQSLSNANSLMSQVGKMGYADLQKSFAQFDDMPEAKAFYEEVNGYANTKKSLSAEEKADGANKFHSFFAEIIGKDGINNNDLKLLQEGVYAGMRKRVLTESEGFGLLNQVLDPVINEQKERAGKFEAGKWDPFVENLGLDTLRDEIKKTSGVGNLTRKPTAEQEFNLKKTSNSMYKTYLETLSKEATSRGTTIAGLSGLGGEEETKIYNKALTKAKEANLRSKYPSLSNVKTENLPSSVIENGKKVPTGLGGKTTGATVASTTTKIFTDKTTGERELWEIDKNGSPLKSIRKIE
tara:strand:- start:4858 stop:6495 length:1638 start_codon:yes stop_codon:yes gene_type:complete